MNRILEDPVQQSSIGKHARLTVPAVDRLIVGLVTFLAFLPFGKIVNLRLGFITLNAFELIYITLVLVLCAKLAVSGRPRFPMSCVMFAVVALIYCFLSVTHFGVPAVEALRQLRFYAPFFVATLLMAVGLQFPLDDYLKTLVLGALVSSASALMIQYLFPGFLEAKLIDAGGEEIYEIAGVHGRLYWPNDSLAFFSILVLFAKVRRLPQAAVLSCAILCGTALVASSARTPLAGLLVFWATLMLISTRCRGSGKLLLKAAPVVALVMATFLLIRADSRVRELIDARFLGRGDVAQVYDRDLVQGRFPLYEAYAESIAEHFPLGQGLGRPFFIRSDGTLVFATDISILAFALPFGIIGLLLFFFFCWRLLQIIRSPTRNTPGIHANMILAMLAVFFLMGLNVDYFSRNNFIIYFAALVMAWRNAADTQVARCAPKEVTWLRR